MANRFWKQQFEILQKVFHGFPLYSKRFCKFRIAGLFAGQLISLPALYLLNVMDPVLLSDDSPAGHPVSGGKALIYYGKISSMSREDLLTVGLPVLLFTVLVAFAAYSTIKKRWAEKKD